MISDDIDDRQRKHQGQGTLYYELKNELVYQDLIALNLYSSKQTSKSLNQKLMQLNEKWETHKYN